MAFIFSFRLIYYYRLENTEKVASYDLSDIILSEENIKNNLYKIDDAYFYRDRLSNNYVIYSGILYRIIKVKDKEITLVSDVPITNLYFDTDYENSYINKYLNDFYNKIDNSLITKTSICIETNSSVSDCLKMYDTNIGLLSIDLYDKAGGINSFINNGYYTYLSDSYEGNYYIDDEGKISKTNNTNLYGIKIVLTINSKDIIMGDGTKDKPYLLDKGVSYLKDALVGNYVSFNEKTFRIIENNEDSVKLIYDDVISNVKLDGSIYNERNNVYSILNTDFIKDNNYVIESNYFNGNFDNNLDKIKESTVNSKVAYANIGDLFINDISNHVLMSVNSLGENVYLLKENSTIYHGNINEEYNIRPIITMQNDLNITGNGTKNNPYKIEEVIDEKDY